MHEAVLALIHRELEHARAGRPAKIVAKMNALVDPDVIDALYLASQAGVTIELVVRGICCLRPGIAGLSERIRVVSVVDRFLEHARVVSFENGGNPEVYLASADWMPRNFQRRVEVMFPVEDPALSKYVREEVLAAMASDTMKARVMRGDGTYERAAHAEGQAPVRSQQRFMDAAREKTRAGRLSMPSSPFRHATLAEAERVHTEGETAATNEMPVASRHVPVPGNSTRRKPRTATHPKPRTG